MNSSYHRRSDIKVDQAVKIAGEVRLGVVVMHAAERDVANGVEMDGLLEEGVADGGGAPLREGGVEMGEG